MNGEPEFRDWIDARRDGAVPDGFADRVMENLAERERRHVALTVALLTLAAAAFVVRVGGVLGLLFVGGGLG
jgi:hypothetical protein